MVVIHSDHHVSHALHSAMLSVHQCDGQESQADHRLACGCHSGLDNDHGSHRSKEKTGSKKESINTITTIRHSLVSVYIHPVQCSICYMCFHSNSFHVVQSFTISIILSDSRLKLSRVIPLSSVASVVNLSCYLHFKNGSSSADLSLSSGQ